MKEVCIPYYFHHHEVRVWCKTNGADGQIVLEDILKILFPKDWESLLERKIDLIRDQVTTRSFLEGDSQKTVYVADSFGAKDFCAFCDDADERELFTEFGNWLDSKCHYIDNDMAHVADTHPKYKESWDYVARVTEEGKANRRVTIDEWLRLEYEIEISWLRTSLTWIIKDLMAHGRRLLTGQQLQKNDNNLNTYLYREFGEVVLEVEKLLAGETIFDKHNFKEKIKNIMYAPAKNNRGEDAVNEEKKVISLLGEKKTDDEIIQELWKTSQSKSPHQYALLKLFLEVVDERSRRKVRR